MVTVTFQRDWRNHRRGSQADIGHGIAVQLERRGFVSRVPADAAEPVPANKAAVSTLEVSRKAPPKKKRRPRRQT